MKDMKLSFDAFDDVVNPKPEISEFDEIVERALSRRGFLGGALAFGGAAIVGGGLAPTAGAAANRFAFEAVAMSTADDFIVPEGFRADVLIRWGDPISTEGPEFDHATRGTAESQKITFGDNNDGMHVFEVGGRYVLAVNNEYTNREVIWGNRADGKAETDDDIWKGMYAHGLSFVEIAMTGGVWSVVKDSPLNRRVTPATPMEITGPAAGHDLMKTAADPSGAMSLGTWNNCGSSMTPWGTYLTCEENFNGYFSSSEAVQDQKPVSVTAEMARYGVSERDWGYGWAKVDERFDIAKHPNEANRAGWVVEVDPGDPAATPKKRTALGRMKHENAETVLSPAGRVVVYLGDDERGEYLYRYVSNGVYAPGVDTDPLMQDGVLYAAKFSDDGAGTWLALTPETTGMASLAEVLIHARLAGDKVGATTMDRPEWVAANPRAPEVYVALTNNRNRGARANAGGVEQVVNGPNPREKNNYGQIVRLHPEGGDHAAANFRWDLFVKAGNPAVHQDAYAGSANITAENMFNSPDGLAFDSTGLLWIQTDGNYSNEGDFVGQGNNQMLAADPVTGEIRRFLVGPNECEITGLTWSPDRRTMFVGVQHPGEDGNSHWPEGGDAAPRSAIMAVTRIDGARIG